MKNPPRRARAGRTFPTPRMVLRARKFRAAAVRIVTRAMTLRAARIMLGAIMMV